MCVCVYVRMPPPPLLSSGEGFLQGGVSRTAPGDPRVPVGTRWPCLVRHVLGRGGQARGSRRGSPTQYPPRGAKSNEDDVQPPLPPAISGGLVIPPSRTLYIHIYV